MSSKRSIAVFLFVAVSIFIVDQTTKWLFFSSDFDGKQILGHMIEFIRHQNSGISFNIPIPFFVTLIITLIVLSGIIYLIVKKRGFMETRVLLGLSMIFGGALGNLLDRIRLEFVRDWLLLFGRSAINAADICILIGILLFLFGDTGLKRKNTDDTLDTNE